MGRPDAQFNADLYVVAATVIPVYFVALMFPGGILAQYTLWARTERSRHIADLRRWRVGRLVYLLMVPVWLVLALGAYGEIQAVLALDHGRASTTEHDWVIAASIALPIIAAVSAVVATSMRRAATVRADAKPAEAPPEPEQSGS